MNSKVSFNCDHSWCISKSICLKMATKCLSQCEPTIRGTISGIRQMVFGCGHGNGADPESVNMMGKWWGSWNGSPKPWNSLLKWSNIQIDGDNHSWLYSLINPKCTVFPIDLDLKEHARTSFLISLCFTCVYIHIHTCYVTIHSYTPYLCTHHHTINSHLSVYFYHICL